MPDTVATLWKRLSSRRRFLLVAGPCVIESERVCLRIAKSLSDCCRKLGIEYVFKASYDKANRTSARSFRGPGLVEGLRVLGRIRRELNVPVLTDVHTEKQAEQAAEVADILQVPAFLCRQTDLVMVVARTGRIVNLKKGQFLAPTDMARVVEKAEWTGNRKIVLTERGTSFGYHNLVADMRAIPILHGTGYPVLFDATHSVQLPGEAGDKSGGQREFAPVLARAAVAAGADGLFMETHPNPNRSLSDGPNMIPLKEMPAFLRSVRRVFKAVH